MKRIEFIKFSLLLIPSPLLFSFSNGRNNTIPSEKCSLLITGGNLENPLDYIPYTGDDPNTDCTGSDQVCIICVFNTDAYTTSGIPTPVHTGKNKVDQGFLKTVIANALVSGVDPIGRVAYFRS